MPKATISKARAKATAEADAPQVLLEHTTLQGEKLRVVIMHAPGIDYFVVVERCENDKWTPVKRNLRDIFSPVNSVIEVTILQLARQLAEAREEIRRMQTPA